MQAVDCVIDDLVATGLFVAQDRLLCPDSHRYCKGLRLARNGVSLLKVRKGEPRVTSEFVHQLREELS